MANETRKFVAGLHDGLGWAAVGACQVAAGERAVAIQVRPPVNPDTPNLGFEAQWNGYGKLSITVPLHPRPQLLSMQNRGLLFTVFQGQQLNKTTLYFAEEAEFHRADRSFLFRYPFGLDLRLCKPSAAVRFEHE